MEQERTKVEETITFLYDLRNKLVCEEEKQAINNALNGLNEYIDLLDYQQYLINQNS